MYAADYTCNHQVEGVVEGTTRKSRASSVSQHTWRAPQCRCRPTPARQIRQRGGSRMSNIDTQARITACAETQCSNGTPAGRCGLLRHRSMARARVRRDNTGISACPSSHERSGVSESASSQGAGSTISRAWPIAHVSRFALIKHQDYAEWKLRDATQDDTPSLVSHGDDTRFGIVRTSA